MTYIQLRIHHYERVKLLYRYNNVTKSKSKARLGRKLKVFWSSPILWPKRPSFFLQFFGENPFIRNSCFNLGTEEIYF